jgi:ribosomal RNA-processing protein 17
MGRKGKKAVKTPLVFDDKERREFLSGFRKRKTERKVKAKEKIEKAVKEEKTRLKQEQKEAISQLYFADRPVPEVQHLVEPVTYDLESHVVTVTSLDATEIAANLGYAMGSNRMLGQGQGQGQGETSKAQEQDGDSDGDGAGDGDDGGQEKEDIGDEEEEEKDAKSGGKKGPSTGSSVNLKQLKKKQKKERIELTKKSRVFQQKHKMSRAKGMKAAHHKKKGSSKGWKSREKETQKELP